MKMPALAFLLPLLAGCAATPGGYPSLAPRAAERTGFDEPAVTAPTAAADPALDTQLRDTTARLDTIVHGFDGDRARAEQAAGVAGARTVGSDAWLSAQTALAALDDWRAQASSLAGDLAATSGERLGTTGAPYPALDALRDRAAAEADREAAAIAALSARLPTS